MTLHVFFKNVVKKIHQSLHPSPHCRFDAGPPAERSLESSWQQSWEEGVKGGISEKKTLGRKVDMLGPLSFWSSAGITGLEGKRLDIYI